MSATANTLKPQSITERGRVRAPEETCDFCEHPELLAISERRFYGRYSTVTRQGDPAARIYFVCSGWLQIAHTTRTGRAVAQLAGPGAILGLTNALTGTEYLYSVRTLEECELRQIECEAFLAFVRDNPYISIHLLKTMSRQWLQMLRHIYQLSTKVPTETRLMDTLREISETCGSPADGGLRIRVPLSVQVLADTVGCSRQWVSKLLGELGKKGLIRYKSGWITITRAGLKDRR